MTKKTRTATDVGIGGCVVGKDGRRESLRVLNWWSTKIESKKATNSLGIFLANVHSNTGQSDHTTADPSTGIASRLAQLNATQSKVIRVSMDDQRTSNDGMRASQRSERVRNVYLGHTVRSGGHIA